MSGKGDKLQGIESARGVAALLVVLFHTGRMLAGQSGLGYTPLGGLFKFGHAGVDFFFVLSGFIICFVHFRDIGRPDRLGRYFWRRLARIYPPYWGITLILMAILLLSPTASGHERNLAVIVNSFLLLPSSDELLLGVAWTLQHEIFFYLVFALLLVSKRLGAIVVALWLAAILVQQLLPKAAFPLNFLLSTYNLQFLMGMGVAALLQTRTLAKPILAVSAGLALFAAAGLSEVYLLDHLGGEPEVLGFRLIYGAASALMILGMVEGERQGRLALPGTMLLLGQASYSIYLVHIVALMILKKAAFSLSLNAFLPGWTLFLLLASGSVVAGLLFHFWVERPLLRGCRNLTLAPALR